MEGADVGDGVVVGAEMVLLVAARGWLSPAGTATPPATTTSGRAIVKRGPEGPNPAPLCCAWFGSPDDIRCYFLVYRNSS